MAMGRVVGPPKPGNRFQSGAGGGREGDSLRPHSMPSHRELGDD